VNNNGGFPFVMSSGNVTLHPFNRSAAVILKACPERAQRVERETSLDISENLFGQINPARAHTLDQRDFLLVRPSLQLLFAGDCVLNVGIMLPKNELVTSIIRRESRNLAGLMFAYSSGQIICHADVEHGIELVGHMAHRYAST
jgi:hypothetical protein